MLSRGLKAEASSDPEIPWANLNTGNQTGFLVEKESSR